MEPADNGPKTLKPWTKINLSSSKLFMPGICYSVEKVSLTQMAFDKNLNIKKRKSRDSMGIHIFTSIN
jgi:hypothetical protein